MTRSALRNAASSAGLFLTIEVVIADKPDSVAAAERAAWEIWVSDAALPSWTFARRALRSRACRRLLPALTGR